MSATRDYLNWLQQQHRYSDNTLKAVQRDLQWLERALTTQHPVTAGKSRDHHETSVMHSGTDVAPDWKSMTADHIRMTLSRARASGLSPASLARLASSFRGFFRYLEEAGVLTTDVMQGVRTPRKARRLPKALSPDEALQILQLDVESADSASHAADASEVPDVDSPSSVSDLAQARVLAELLYGSGLRISEALGLDRSEHAWQQRSKGVRLMGGWLDEAAGELHVMGKGAKPRVVPLGSQALQALKAFMAQPFDCVSGSEERPVFVNRRGLRLSVRSAQRLLALLAQQSGLDRHVHPHMLRHSFASHVLQSSGDLRAVQELMGHASIASTQVYTSLDFQHLSAVYDKAHPRARSKPS